MKTGLLSGLALGNMGSPEMSNNRVITAEEEEITKKMNHLLGVGVGVGSPGGVEKGDDFLVSHNDIPDNPLTHSLSTLR